jgi:hypothetical protein
MQEIIVDEKLGDTVRSHPANFLLSPISPTFPLQPAWSRNT